MTPTETLVSQMWGQIIGTQAESVEDDFFDLGGHSVHLIEFLQQILAVFQVELNLVDLFAAGFTLAECAGAIDRARSGQGPVPSGCAA
jgi:Phosphopantetheine attachment site